MHVDSATAFRFHTGDRWRGAGDGESLGFKGIVPMIKVLKCVAIILGLLALIAFVCSPGHHPRNGTSLNAGRQQAQFLYPTSWSMRLSHPTTDWHLETGLVYGGGIIGQDLPIAGRFYRLGPLTITRSLRSL